MLDTITYGNGNQVSYVYNADYDWVTQLKYNRIAKFYYSYDNSGNLYKKEDLVNSQTTEYFYDFTKRPVRTKNSNGLTLLYNYDSKNRISSYSNVLNGTTTKTGYVYGDSAVSGQKPGLITGVKVNDSQVLYYGYDSMSRLQSKSISMAMFGTSYAYAGGAAENTTTTRLESINNSGYYFPANKISYTYDVKGNIRTISENAVQKASYDYDNLSQLIRENNQYINKTITYFYDAGGNITEKREYAYTTGTLGTPTLVIPYTYTDPIWRDKLTTYNNGAAIIYDAIGNPTLLDGRTFTWENGRRLASTTKFGVTSTYKYDDSGIRTQKTVGAFTTNYFLNGDRVEIETNDTDTIKYFYDEKGDLFEFNIKNTAYPAGANFYYIRNGQNDIIGILDSTGHPVVSYVYDSWGKLISTTGTLATTIGVQNPYRYRGYRYDVETGLYYVISRYYDPTTCRFINTDAVIGAPGDLTGENLFAYCRNNPVNKTDSTGMWCPEGDGRNERHDANYGYVVSASKQPSNVVASNSLPKTGEPGSSQTLPNPDGTPKQKRWYGPDRTPERDRDYNHPGDIPFPHDHDWSNGERNKDHLPPDPSYKFSWDPMLGAGLVVVCGIGIALVAIDVATVIGVADDFLFGPLGAGAGKGLIMIFG